MGLDFLYSGASIYQGVQTDPDKSLGGFCSRSKIPNGSIGSIFSDVSEITKQANRPILQPEYRAAFLRNCTASPITALSFYYLYPRTAQTKLEVAIEPVSALANQPTTPSYITSIPSRFSDPGLDFVEAGATQAYATWQILAPLQPGNTITVLGVTTQPLQAGQSAIDLVMAAFIGNATWTTESTTINGATSPNAIIFSYIAPGINTSPITWSSTDVNFNATTPNFANGSLNPITVIPDLIATFAPQALIGLWFKLTLLPSILAQLTPRQLYDAYSAPGAQPPSTREQFNFVFTATP